MSALKRKVAVSVVSAFLMFFLCYAVIPRTTTPTFLNEDAAITLIIDPGHGGEDGGAVAGDGTRESVLNLEIALRTENLAALLGVKPVMTRGTDVSIYDSGCTSIADKKSSDLRNRVSLVERTPMAVLLSIHQNHFSESKYHGAQVFYAKTTGSESLAECMQQDLRTAIDPANHRKCKPAEGIYLLQHISCPAVLVECGFLSNSAEARQLQEETHQIKLTMSILRGIVRQGKAVYEGYEI